MLAPVINTGGRASAGFSISSYSGLLASSCFFSFCILGRLWTYDAPEAGFPGFTGCRPVPHPKLVSSCEASSCDPWYDHSINTSLCFHPRIQKTAPLGVNSDIPGKSCSKSCLVLTVREVGTLYSAALLEIHWNEEGQFRRVLLPEAGRKGCGTSRNMEVDRARACALNKSVRTAAGGAVKLQKQVETSTAME